MSLTRVRNYQQGDDLNADDFTGELDNILQHPMSLISPVTSDLDMDGWALHNGVFTHTILAFADADATPSVANGTIFRTANTAPTTITFFDNGTTGQFIWIWINDVNTTFDFTGTNLKGNAGADWSPAVDDAIEAIFTGTRWLCRISKNV